MVRARAAAPSRRRSHATGAARARETFSRDWNRRTKTLARLTVGSGRELSVDDVHDLRVTTRRLRASLSVLRHSGRRSNHRKVRRALRALGRTLGERRMLDVALADARRYRMDAAALEKRHAKARRALERALAPSRTKKLVADLRSMGTTIGEAPFDRISHWLANLEWEIAYRLQAPPRTAEERHRLRIQVKKVRYVLESFGHRSPSIRRLQDHLGREHDLAVLQALAGRNARAAGDERAARAKSRRSMAPALRSALLHLRSVRRDLAPR